MGRGPETLADVTSKAGGVKYQDERYFRRDAARRVPTDLIDKKRPPVKAAIILSLGIALAVVPAALH